MAAFQTLFGLGAGRKPASHEQILDAKMAELHSVINHTILWLAEQPDKQEPP
jgi:hypothetical protein